MDWLAPRTSALESVSADIHRTRYHQILNMAKGIRSKSKRANRSLIRKTLTEPITRKRQELIAESIRRDLAEKGGDSIKSLASLLPGAKAEKGDTDEMEQEEELEDGGVEAQQGGKLAKTGSKQKGFSFLRRDLKPKGSKPRNNPGKELVWFK